MGTRTACCYLGDGVGESGWAASGIVYDDYDYDQVGVDSNSVA